MSAKSYGRKINKTTGYGDDRLGTNQEITTDSTGKQNANMLDGNLINAMNFSSHSQTKSYGITCV